MSGMKRTPLVNTLWRKLQDTVTRVRSSRFFNDKLSVGLFATALLTNLVTMAWLLYKVRPTDVPVPVRFSNLLYGFDQLGSWYFPFLIGGYALLVTLVNGFFAYHSFGRSRLVSFFLLMASNVVGAFGFIIASAFGVIR
jgi:hypothetical protein